MSSEMKYRIDYNHTSSGAASSRDAAIRAVKDEAGQNRMYYADTPDGLFCYLTRAHKLADQTGADAFAVIRLAGLAE